MKFNRTTAPSLALAYLQQQVLLPYLSTRVFLSIKPSAVFPETCPALVLTHLQT